MENTEVNNTKPIRFKGLEQALRGNEGLVVLMSIGPSRDRRVRVEDGTERARNLQIKERGFGRTILEALDNISEKILTKTYLSGKSLGIENNPTPGSEKPVDNLESWLMAGKRIKVFYEKRQNLFFLECFSYEKLRRGGPRKVVYMSLFGRTFAEAISKFNSLPKETPEEIEDHVRIPSIRS